MNRSILEDRIKQRAERISKLKEEKFKIKHKIMYLEYQQIYADYIVANQDKFIPHLWFTTPEQFKQQLAEWRAKMEEKYNEFLEQFDKTAKTIATLEKNQEEDMQKLQELSE
ncbi:hypothetical protein [Caldisericum exile]|uniref:hypothetical protein n=1 Tax=Caldisericum exile TaxID=693075 RepID=UPI003C7422F4